MNNKQLDALIRKGDPVMKSLDTGLYFRIARGKPSWVVKYTINGKRSQISLDGSYPHVSIVSAKLEAAQLRDKISAGIDPKAARAKNRKKQYHFQSVNDLFEDWLETDIKRRLKHPHIPKRIYTNELKPLIGELAPKDVEPTDIRDIIQAIVDSGRPSTGNQTLMYAKQMFRHAVKLGLLIHNPAQAFTQSDAGGVCIARDRMLTLEELAVVFKVLRDNPLIFTRQNYLAIALLTCLAVRKGELISARWEHFDLEKQLWHMPAENKTGVAITVPLPEPCTDWLKELKVHACGSDYVFPSRRLSRRREYISDDTLNHALAKMFGKKVDSNKEPYENMLGKASIEHFTIHDLRRTCRSLLAAQGTPGHIAERCLNHKLKGVEGIYDRHDYLKERKAALDKLSQTLKVIINNA
ncbi:integrase [Agarivorans sp. Toyoura001]|uniref:tyrosine-type recombinase/integrase n=1 Tax=Agarivorans sp. Toyoura001 TaxID=2283141 RepID=UPI0010E48AD0|nr:site-specific integrase [Agarivorans sp. Toyoura001]GDY28273.1 integrase [Agarivorans sp. Toyoura001]